MEASSQSKSKAKKIYEEIILSKNEFYSILALNKLIEENLINDKKIILNYFKMIEKSLITNDYKELIIFKKALYLIKNSDIQGGNQLLKSLVNKKDSALKLLAQELLED